MRVSVTSWLVQCLCACRPLGIGPRGLQRRMVALAGGDYRTAYEAMRPLAEAGNSKAQNVLGMLHADGLAGPRDPAQAAQWFRRAADQGNAAAQYRLAGMYAFGLGIPCNEVEALTLYSRLARRGRSGLAARAQYNLGAMYLTGRGVSRDHVQAFVWFALATRHGSSTAPIMRQHVAGLLSSAKLAKTRRLARLWRPAE